MILNEKDKIIYELRFDRYIRMNIKGTFMNLEKEMYEREGITSLNEVTNGGEERIVLLRGDNDIKMHYRESISKLENLMNSDELYDAVKPLTLNEKSVVFYYFYRDYNETEIAEIMEYKHKSSVSRLLQSAFEKLREFLDGGKKK